MTYMLVIIEEPGQRATRTTEQSQAVYDRMVAFASGLAARGLMTSGESLANADGRSARVQVRGGQPLTVDGPFAEAKEMIGGFFMLTVNTREEAIAIARTCPAAEWATVEVREVGPCFG